MYDEYDSEEDEDYDVNRAPKKKAKKSAFIIDEADVDEEDEEDEEEPEEGFEDVIHEKHTAHDDGPTAREIDGMRRRFDILG